MIPYGFPAAPLYTRFNIVVEKLQQEQFVILQTWSQTHLQIYTSVDKPVCLVSSSQSTVQAQTKIARHNDLPT